MVESKVFLLMGMKLTFMRSTGSVCCAAVLSRAEYSMYSTMRCRNDKGSLKMTGIVILLSSLPMQFFSTDQTLKSLWLYIGTGKLCLLARAPRKTHHIVSDSLDFRAPPNPSSGLYF